jgi:hypothetical protein
MTHRQRDHPDKGHRRGRTPGGPDATKFVGRAPRRMTQRPDPSSTSHVSPAAAGWSPHRRRPATGTAPPTRHRRPGHRPPEHPGRPTTDQPLSRSPARGKPSAWRNTEAARSGSRPHHGKPRGLIDHQTGPLRRTQPSNSPPLRGGRVLRPRALSLQKSGPPPAPRPIRPGHASPEGTRPDTGPTRHSRATGPGHPSVSRPSRPKNERTETTRS